MAPRLRYHLTFFTTFLAVLMLSCTQEDSLTGAGSEIINIHDPELNDPDGNFRSLNSRNFIKGGFSLPLESDSTFGHHFGKREIMVGSIGNQNMLGYAGFYIPFRDTTKKYKFNNDDQLLSAYLHINADTSHENESSQTVQVYISSPKSPNELVRFNPEDPLLGTATIAAESKDSIRLPDDLASAMYDIVTFNRSGVDSTDLPAQQFAFTFPDSSESLNYILAPYITFNILAKDTIQHTLRSISEYTVYEKDGDSLSQQPVSSVSSRRIAVLELDLNQIYDSVYNTSGTDFEGILSGRFEFEGKPSTELMRKDDNVSFRYILMDTLITNQNTLNNLFSNITTPVVIKDKNFTISIRAALQNIIRSGRPDSAYLYIQTVGSKNHLGQIEWSTPYNFQAVLTTIR
ncbi:hypothetical protein CHISP_1409 [Chitinispirillum alkaliphilum]|nr:hypothetical protein CHISP_1409 [Chitinispirillum alkaliphilum]